MELGTVVGGAPYPRSASAANRTSRQDTTGEGCRTWTVPHPPVPIVFVTPTSDLETPGSSTGSRRTYPPIPGSMRAVGPSANDGGRVRLSTSDLGE